MLQQWISSINGILRRCSSSNFNIRPVVSFHSLAVRSWPVRPCFPRNVPISLSKDMPLKSHETRSMTRWRFFVFVGVLCAHEKRQGEIRDDGGEVVVVEVAVCKCPVSAICLTSRLEISRLSPGAYVKSAVY